MIRIKLLDGEIVETHLHTYEQATAAKEAGVAIVVGGPDDRRDATNVQEPTAWPRTIYPEAIATIEEVS